MSPFCWPSSSFVKTMRSRYNKRRELFWKNRLFLTLTRVSLRGSAKTWTHTPGTALSRTHSHSRFVVAQFKSVPFAHKWGVFVCFVFCLTVIVCFLHFYTYITFFSKFIIFTHDFCFALRFILASPLKVTCSQFVNVVFSCFLYP